MIARMLLQPGVLVLGLVGVLILIECLCIEAASNAAYKRGFEEGRAAGKIDADVWWLEQGAQVQKVREEIWRESK